MAYKVRTRDEHFLNDGNPKRILALDGGGLRGIVTLSFLAEVESMLRERHGRVNDFRLSHYFDLIAGTSTGAIIAAALARNMTVAEITKQYLSLGHKVFQRGLLRQGFFRALYDEAGLIQELKTVFGEETTMDDASIKTGLLIVAKRLDTCSCWPISNNPRGKYYQSRSGSDVIANAAYPLWQVVRASTAAPRYFEPERIDITRGKPGERPVAGEFVDGGVSPFNNPALQALMYATLDGYRVGWPIRADKLFLVSVGTGSRDPSITPTGITAADAVKSLLSLMDDCGALMETLLQWMSVSSTARVIDRELGDLGHDLVASAPLLTYLRYNVELNKASLAQLNIDLPDNTIEDLSAMDDPNNMDMLQQIGARAAKQQVCAEDFPSNFDLPS